MLNPAPAVRSQCRCDDLVRCSNAAPPPCDVLRDLAWRCQEGCAPCGESNVDVPAPCGPQRVVGAGDPEIVTGEQLDQRGVQQGATEQ